MFGTAWKFSYEYPELHVPIDTHISKAENLVTQFSRSYIKKYCFFLTNFKAFGSWVALFIPLATSELHQLHV
jgi:hypothetical protein